MGKGIQSGVFDRFAAVRLCRLVAIALIVVGTLCAPEPAHAQVLYGSIVGNVTDPNGAVVPGAAVTATDQNTRVAKTTTTNQAGAYQFIDLQSGTYTVKVVMGGFKAYERHGVPVELNNTTRADVALEVGSIEQSVTITA